HHASELLRTLELCHDSRHGATIDDRAGSFTRSRAKRLRASDRLDDLAGLEAARADVRARGLAVDQRADALQVGVEAPLRRPHRVAPVVTERRLLPADGADLRHAAANGSGRQSEPDGYRAAAARRCENRSAISSAVRTASAPFAILDAAWSSRSSVS